jgi:hypothetical protein
MSLIDKAAQAVRLAGTRLAGYAGNPATYSDIGRKVALEAGLGTAVSQAVPAMLGSQAPGIGQTALNIGLHSAMSHPISGAMQALGAPAWAANTTGQILGGAGAQMLSHAVSRPITPEPQQAMNPDLAQYMQIQQMNAAIEQQRYDNEIKLAMAKNYHPPSRSTVVHQNPSGDIQSVLGALSYSPKY